MRFRCVTDYSVKGTSSNATDRTFGEVPNEEALGTLEVEVTALLDKPKSSRGPDAIRKRDRA